MNLSEVIDLTEDQDKGRWLDLANPYDGKPTGIRLLIAGPDSRTQARARLQMADELAEFADETGRVIAEHRETAQLRFLARCILQWEAEEDGKPVALTMEGATRLLKAGRWVREQVDEFAGTRRPYARGGL